MRRSSLAITLVIVASAGVARADEAPSTSIYAEAGTSGGGALGAAGLEHGGGIWRAEVDDASGERIGWGADYAAGGEVRAVGAALEGSVTARGRALVGAELGGPGEEPLFGLEVDGGLGVRPGLDARRDVGRGGYTHAGARGRFVLAYDRTGDRRRGGLEGQIGSRVVVQGAQARVEHTMAMRGWFRCRVRDGTVPRCTDYFLLDATGVTGGTEAVIGTLTPVRWRGVALPGGVLADVAVGGLSNSGTMTIEQDGQVVEEITTEDLPTISALAWDVAATRAWGDTTLEARSRRTGWITLDGDMSIEERQSLAVRARRGRTRLGATGYAARTQWWTSRHAPGQTALTAGADAWITGPVRGLDAELRVAAGRSFYPALDGGAAAAPGLGVDATLTVRRAIAGPRE